MKSLLLIAVCLLSMNSFAESFLAKKVFVLNELENVEQEIVKLYKEEMKKTDSSLKKVMTELNEKEVEGLGYLGEPSESDILQISQGRGGAGYWGSTKIVGIPVSWKGTGMIVGYLTYLVVHVDHNMDTEKSTITFSKIKSVDFF